MLKYLFRITPETVAHPTIEDIATCFKSYHIRLNVLLNGQGVKHYNPQHNQFFLK